MSKKSSFTIILLTVLISACQPDPTLVNSTQHKPANQSSSSHSSMNHNGSIHSDEKDNPLKTETTEHGAMNHSENHSEMKSAPDAAAQPYDLQFLDTMIAHHQGAIAMAKPAAGKAQNADLKTLAAKIVADQEKEISQMKQWREQWFTGKPAALNMEMAGMTDSMKGMDMTKLGSSSGNAFDLEFINQMTTHHQGAIVMGREALQKAEHAEIKLLAGKIIKAQETEIKQMQTWKTQSAK